MINLKPFSFAVLISSVFSVCCEKRDIESELGWPEDPKELVAHLNSWDVEQLVAANEGGAPADETIMWIDRHIYELNKMSIQVTWSAESDRYEISDSSGHTDSED